MPALAGFTAAIQVGVLSPLNRWNATHAVMCGIAAALVVGASGDGVAEGDR